jgi:hypothetical protein
MTGLTNNGLIRESFRLLIKLNVYSDTPDYSKPGSLIDSSTLMHIAKKTLSIQKMLTNVDLEFQDKKGFPIRCEKVYVEDHYEVNPNYTVGECFGDMAKVLVLARKLKKNEKQ